MRLNFICFPVTIQEEVEGEGVKNEEPQEAEESQGEDSAEPVPENKGEESVEEIDEIKPHSEIKSNNSGMIEETQEPVITPNNAPVVSPSTQVQV